MYINVCALFVILGSVLSVSVSGVAPCKYAYINHITNCHPTHATGQDNVYSYSTYVQYFSELSVFFHSTFLTAY